MSGLIYALPLLGLFAVAFVVWRSLRTARVLHDRCIAELQHLRSLVTSRHLILSHLTDSIPASLDSAFDRRRLNRKRQRAEKAVQSIDPADVDSADLRTFGDVEQQMLEVVEDLKKTLEESDQISQIHSVIGCLEGLEKTDVEILDAVSTYNAATITYAGFVESSVIARRYFRCSFTLLDLDPQASCISTNRVVS